MPDQSDVRRIALSLPEVVEQDDRFAFAVRHVVSRGKHAGSVKLRTFAWVWLERVHPKRGRVPQPDVLAICVPDLVEKEAMLAARPDVLFTEPHYDGYAAVMVRLDTVELDELEELITDAWRCQAPAQLVERLDAEVRRDQPL